MNPTIKKIVDLLFDDLVETDEVRAIHEEVLTNCQERYEDMKAQGLSEDDAIHAVVESLSGMEDMLAAYKRRPAERVETEDTHLQAFFFDPARQPIHTLQMLQMGSLDVEVRPSDDGLVHVEFEDVSGGIYAAVENGVLTVRTDGDSSRRKMHVHVDINLQDFVGLWKRHARGFTRLFRISDVHVRIPRDLCPCLEVQGASGDVNIRDLCLDALSVSTTSGDIEVQVNRLCSRAELRATSGDVELRLPSGLPACVCCHSTSGDITQRVPSHSSAAIQVNISTTSGDIDVQEDD